MINSFSPFISKIEKESCYILGKNNSIIGTCFKVNKNKFEYKYENLNKPIKSETMKAPINVQENYIHKHIELFIEFYLFYEEMNKKINQSLFISKKEKYYIIRKKWTNKFMEYFEYNKFIEVIRKGNINRIIGKYKTDNNYSDFLVEILKLLPNDYKKCIRAKIKDKNAFKTFSKYFNVQLKNKEIKSGKPIYYYYYSNIDIINKEILKLIKEIFEFEYQEEERIFFIGDNKIIMDFNLENQISLIVGNYINNNFVPDILFVFDNKEYLNNFCKNFKSKGYIKAMKNINMNNYLYDEKSKKIGYIYNIEFLNNYQIEKKEIFLLNYFFQNQIKALISYYYYIEELKSNILFSKQQSQNVFSIGKCHLIDETWMNLHKKTFLYQELIKIIEQIRIKYSIQEPKQNIREIFDKLDIKYIKALKDKEKERTEELLKNFAVHVDNFIEKYKDKNILIYPCKYDILNQETLQLMNKSPDNEILSILKDRERDYLINDGQLIIKIESTSSNRYELLIGNFNIEKEKFIPELLFKYYSSELMRNHFEKLKQDSFKNFVKSHATLNGKELTLRTNGNKNNQIIGKIYELKDDNWKKEKINKINENIIIKKEKTKIKETHLILSENTSNTFKDFMNDDYIDELKKQLDEERKKIKLLESQNDKIISVLFVTQGNQDIFNYSMACRTTDLFSSLEERLYQDFPKYRNIEKIFMVQAKRIFRDKTLEENNIRNNDIISLFPVEE